MTDDQLADLCIAGFQKIKNFVPYITALHKRFTDGKRDSKNRLKTPIKGCYSWTEFCPKYLDRCKQALDTAMREKPTPAPRWQQEKPPSRKDLIAHSQVPKTREGMHQRIAKDFRQMAELYEDYREWAPVFELAEQIAKELGAS